MEDSFPTWATVLLLKCSLLVTMREIAVIGKTGNDPTSKAVPVVNIPPLLNQPAARLALT